MITPEELSELVQRLRKLAPSIGWAAAIYEAADALEAQAEWIAELERELKLEMKDCVARGERIAELEEKLQD